MAGDSGGSGAPTAANSAAGNQLLSQNADV